MAALPALSSAPNATMTPVSSSRDTAVIDAWKEAGEKYKKSLSKKDLLQVQIPTGPADIVKEIESWHLKVNNSKSTKVATAVGRGLAQLQRFTASIDMLAQGSPAPGCLLWGSIKFALTIVQHAVDEYERLCKALTRMVECLPRVELYSETFMDSSLVRDCVDAFYVSALQFWSRACKFYRRGRFWNFIHTGWKDYDIEFRKLEENMDKNRDRIEKSALAEHIGQSKVARIHQQATNLTLLENQSFTRKKEIIAWLSPSAYDVKYYQNDFEAAKKKRHLNTCQWLLKNAEFTQFSATDAYAKPLLWIYAKPGAGKTVLASYLIEYYRKRATTHMSNTVLYFFCKNLDEDKNSDIAIIRSLLYQMLQSIENHIDHCALSDDLGKAIDDSGKQRAMDFMTMWLLFTVHISKLTQPVIILDALDECKEPKMLVQKLTNLSKSNGIKVILTSRKESHLSKMLADKLSFEIRPEDVDADIKAFVEAKVSKQPLLCHNLVRDKVVKNLSEAHAGMFLWVYLMLKELKACRSVEQVEEALRKLPEGLPAIYKSILRRLCKSLKSPALDLAKKVLVWVVSALRPLRIEEISEALTFHYKIEGHTLLTDEQLFPYANKDMELVCGSLLTVRDGTIQVIHLTVKEFLGDKEAWTNSADSYTQLLVDPSSASLQLTLVSLKYISQKLTEPLVDPDAREIFQDKMDQFRAMRLNDRLEQSSFTEYASFNWLTHMVDCEGVSGDQIVEAFQSAFDSKATFCWIEMCLTLDPSSFHRIRVVLEHIIEWADLNVQYAPRSINQYTFLKNWCSTIPHVIDDMGSVLRPQDIYFMDFSETFRSNGLGRVFDNHGHFVAREVRTFFDESQSHLSVQAHTSPINPLQLRVASSGSLGFFIYDHTRHVFITADDRVKNGHEFLHIQDAKTGRRLPPVIDLEALRLGEVRSSTMSNDGKYLGIVYDVYPASIGTSIWQIDSNLDFKKRMRSGSWARKVFSKELKFAAGVGASIVYGDDGYIYSPVGRIHLASDTVAPIPFLFPTMGYTGINDTWYREGRDCAYFSTKGDCFVQDTEDSQGSVIRYSIQEPESREHHLMLKTRLSAVSPTGRYLISVPDDREEIGFRLYDTTSKESFSVPHIQCPREDHVFKFSEDENRVFCFGNSGVGIGDGLEALVMDLGGNTPRVRSYGKSNRWIHPASRNLSICDDKDKAWIHTKEREVYEVDLSTPKIDFPKGFTMTEDFPYCESDISTDGMSLLMVRFGKTKAYMQKFNLSMPEQAARRFDLGGEFDGSAGIKFSQNQDGSILLNGMNLYHLPNMKRNLNMNDDNQYEDQSIAIEPILVAPPPDDFEGFINQKSIPRSYRVWIKHDKDPVAYVCWYHDETGLSLYRVHLDIPSSFQLDIPPFIHMTNFCFNFHPSLPLAVLSYRKSSENRLIVKTLDLNDLNIKSVQIYEGIHEAIERYRNLPFAHGDLSPRFSDCGTHINFNTLCFGQLQIEPRPIRILRDYWGLLYKDEFYDLVFYNSGEIYIEFGRAGPPILSDGERDTENFNQLISDFYESISRSLTSYPSYLNMSTTTILLGSTDHDLMRIVFVSDNGHLEMKTLLWTFAEMRSQLIDEWEKRDLEEGKAISSKEMIFTNDKFVKPPNKDLSPSDLITWFSGCKWSPEILENGSESESQESGSEYVSRESESEYESQESGSESESRENGSEYESRESGSESESRESDG